MWFVFELVIWPQEVTLAIWTQPSGPLCLWQCFLILATCSSYSAKVHFTHCPFLFAARAVLSGTWYESWYNSCKRFEENNGLYFHLQYKVHQYPCHSVLEHGPHRHSGIGGGWMRWMATDLSQEYCYKVTSLRSFIRVNKIRIFESYLDQHLNSSIRPTGCQAACR